VPVADPTPVVIADDEGVQQRDEIIGSYRCPDPTAIVTGFDADGALVCEVQP
jgi:hypothetical protein